jgi:hypothetical protein
MTATLTLSARAAITARILREAKAAPYAYGVNDCFFLGLRQIDALRRTAYEAAHAGAYSTLSGANRALRRRGHTSLATYFMALGEQDGWGPIAWGSARIGDVAVIEIDGAEHVGIHGGRAWQSITEAGPAHWDLCRAIQAFKV